MRNSKSPKAQIKLVANCGCGYRAEADADAVLDGAVEHAAVTGHSLFISGRVNGVKPEPTAAPWEE